MDDLSHGHALHCRFFEDKIHAKEVLVEKLALKNTTYKAAIQKLEAQLEHKEEMGEVGMLSSRQR